MVKQVVKAYQRDAKRILRLVPTKSSLSKVCSQSCNTVLFDELGTESYYFFGRWIFLFLLLLFVLLFVLLMLFPTFQWLHNPK